MWFKFRLASPLVHGGFSVRSTGNSTLMRRMPLWHEGAVVEVPVLSGNALRGRLRRLLMRDWLTGTLWPSPDNRPPEWDWIYAILANGGMLDGHDATVNIERVREVRSGLPPLSVLGSAMRKWFLPGKMQVGIVWPVCDVTVAAGLVQPGAYVPSLADIGGEYSHVRMTDRDWTNTADTGQKPMPHSFEGIMTGVSLQSEILFSPDATELERAAVVYGIGKLEYLGGKSGSGMGRLDDMDIPHEDKAYAYADWLHDVAAQDNARMLLQRECA